MEIKYSVYTRHIEERGDFRRFGLTSQDLDDLARRCDENHNWTTLTDEAAARAAFEEAKGDVYTEQHAPGVAGYRGPHLDAFVLYLDREEWDGDDFVQGDTLDYFAVPLSPNTENGKE